MIHLRRRCVKKCIERRLGGLIAKIREDALLCGKKDLVSSLKRRPCAVVVIPSSIMEGLYQKHEGNVKTWTVCENIDWKV